MKTPLSLLAFASLLAAGCSGGGGGGGNQGDPCCNATGATETPASFAPSATRFAQPIVFTTTAECIALDSPDVLVLPLFTELGDAVPVDTVTGRYSVVIDEDGAGQDVLIRIFDSADGVGERGVAPVPAVPSPDAAEPYEVAPIRFTPGKIGESTLETGVFCAMRNDTLGGGLQGNLTFPDVRAAISSQVATAFADGTSNVVAVGVQVGRYRHGINGIVNQIPESQKATFAEVRRAAEAEAERVRSLDGSPQAEARGALARYRSIANSSALAGLGLPQPAFKHLHAWSQDVVEELEGGTGPDSDSRFETFRALELLRFAIAEERILAAAVQTADLDLSPNNPDSAGDTVTTILARLENSLLAAASLPAFKTAWDIFSNELIRNVSDNNPGISTQLPTVTSDVDPVSNAFLAEDLSDGVLWTHANLLLRLYQGDGGSIPGAWVDMRVAMDQLSPPPPAADRDRLNDFYYYSKINSVP